MPLSSAEFLKMACALAFERGTRLIEDDDLPKLRERGLTDEDIARYKEELERSRDIRNHHDRIYAYQPNTGGVVGPP
jgi:hypothetical protein